MTVKNLMITLDDGLIMTCLFPLFSALYMDLRASLSTLTLTMLTLPEGKYTIVRVPCWRE